MLVIALVLSVFAIGFFCWLLFTLAIYALPFFAGLTAAFAAYHHGAGVLGATVVALVVGFLTLAIGQLAFALIRSPAIRAGIALAFAVPAAMAGYSATFGLLHLGIASEAWCTAFGVFGAALVGMTAFARLTTVTRPGPRVGTAAVHL